FEYTRSGQPSSTHRTSSRTSTRKRDLSWWRYTPSAVAANRRRWPPWSPSSPRTRRPSSPAATTWRTAPTRRSRPLFEPRRGDVALLGDLAGRLGVLGAHSDSDRLDLTQRAVHLGRVVDEEESLDPLRLEEGDKQVAFEAVPGRGYFDER